MVDPSRRHWNFADVWETIAEAIPDEPALVHGAERRTWAELDRRATAVARTLVAHGAQPQDKVAQYLYNGNEYIEALFATMKAGLVPVNSNYRYLDGELVYLWDNADVVAVVLHGSLAERVEHIRAQLPRIALWLWVDDGSGSCPSWAVPFEEAAAANGPPLRDARSDDDLLLLYTGGTTGMPKGVMWRQDDLYNSFSQGLWKDPTSLALDAVRERVTTRRRPVGLPACPLMHGTGLFGAMASLSQGGSVVTLPKRSFDVDELLTTIDAEHVNIVSLVGEAFAKPMVDALDAEPTRWHLGSLVAIVSSGVMLSESTKRSLLQRQPRLRIVDALSSSEALGIAQSVSTADRPAATARFSLADGARVVTEDGRDVEPGSGEVGLVAVAGYQPIGYYKDPDKSASTFRLIDGVRHSVPGDYATVEADGTLTLLGRGSASVNTGGEKVFPEEVEEVLKEHPSVRDAAVVGLPDARFGEVVVVVVEAAAGHTVDATELRDHARAHLAAYKAPRHVVVVDSLGRGANGKLAYARLREQAAQLMSEMAEEARP